MPKTPPVGFGHLRGFVFSTADKGVFIGNLLRCAKCAPGFCAPKALGLDARAKFHSRDLSGRSLSADGKPAPHHVCSNVQFIGTSIPACASDAISDSWPSVKLARVGVGRLLAEIRATALPA